MLYYKKGSLGMKIEEMYIYQDILKEVDKVQISEIDLQKYIYDVLALAKKILNIKNVNLKFEPMEENKFGASDNTDTIIVNKNLLKMKNIYELTKTIFHECRHIYQGNRTKIKIGEKIVPTIPLLFCDETIFYLDSIFTQSQCYNFYLTSFSEKDARDFANEMCLSLYQYLEKNIKNHNPQKLAKILRNACQKDIKVEEKEYREAMYSQEYNNAKIKNIVKRATHNLIEKAKQDVKYLRENQEATKSTKEYADFIEDEEIQMKISHINFSFLVLELKLCALVSIYCDDEMKKEILDFCVSNLDNETLATTCIMLNNYSTWNPTKEDVTFALKLLNKWGSSFDEICTYLSRFDKNDLAVLYAPIIESKITKEKLNKQSSKKIDGEKIK